MVKTDALLSRRKLLVTAGVVGTAAVAALTPLRTVLINATRDLVKKQPTLRRWIMPLAQAGYDDWLAQVGATFTVGGGTSLKLAGVRAFAAAGTRPSSLSRDRAFVAMFDVQNRRTLPGDLIFTITHPIHGAFQLFLSAAGDPRTPGRMLAVFN
jgi:hypothetical protein